MSEVTLENLGAEIGRIFKKVGDDSKRMIAGKMQGAPARFLREALAYYPQVLHVRTGRLRQSFAMVARESGDNWEAGLKSDVEYAPIQHYGGQTRPHVIEPRTKKALFWPGAAHPVRSVNHPGSRIRAKYFFSKPMEGETEKIFNEIKQEIGFK